MLTCCDVELGRLWDSVFLPGPCKQGSKEQNQTGLAYGDEDYIEATTTTTEPYIDNMASGSGRRPGVAVSVNVGFILLI